MQDERSVKAASASLLVDIDELTAELRDVTADEQRNVQTAASYHDVSSNLIRTSLSVLKLEKQTRVQKVRSCTPGG